MTDSTTQGYEAAIAIIGMSGRFPGAPTVDALWDNVVAGIRSIRRFTDAELLAAGVEPALLRHPNYVKAGTVVDRYDHFDAAFFGYPPREAEVIDPQHRLFLECAWEALEDAAYNPERYGGLIGVFAGSAPSAYAINNLITRPDVLEQVGLLPVSMNNEVDSLATTVSYKLNLRGPSITVQTFCSTSLVAVHSACRSLLTYECNIALAGGVMLNVPHGTGYLYDEGGIVSPDGYCRTFDAHAQGRVVGNGLGVVALKRMEDALADGDQIYAVILGSAVNNDGIRKVGYTAPGLNGQAEVIRSALLTANVSPETIGYLEAHGSATLLGDSIEVAALTRVFRKSTAKKQFCALGSVKPNVGHLDRASGVTGLIKATMALHHKQLPPSIDVETPNPEFDLANSPFFVNTSARPWPNGGVPRRAGVSSFGFGGTNAHVVLEEAPRRRGDAPARPRHLLLLSAKSEAALETMTANLAAHLRAHPEQELADVAFTLQVGRAGFNHRRALLARDRDEAIAALEGRDPARLLTLQHSYRDRAVAFLLPGEGQIDLETACALAAREPAFKAALEQCCDLLLPLLGRDLRPLLFPADERRTTNDQGATGIGRTPDASTGGIRPSSSVLRPGGDALQFEPLYIQPAIFAVEYALAQLLASWGVKPAALLGYSLGEYVAACLAGVLSLEDALKLVVARARLTQALPGGAVLVVKLGAEALQPYLGEGVELAAANTPEASVLAGPEGAIAAAEARLSQAGVFCRRLAADHVFHSQMLAPAAEELTALARTLTLSPPQTPYLSNVTGTWITAADATDPAYWGRHLVQTLRFSEGVAALLAQGERAVLELGPGAGLSALVRQHPACGPERQAQIVPMLPAQHEDQDPQAGLLGALARLWLLDVPIRWGGFYGKERRLRVRLPTYPFERQRLWIEPGHGSRPVGSPEQRPDLADRFAAISWRRASQGDPGDLARALARRRCWLLFADEHGVGAALAAWLEAHGQDCVTVRPGPQFAREDTRAYTVRPDARDDYDTLLRDLASQELQPTQVLHLWSLSPASEESLAPDAVAETLRLGFSSLLALAQALGEVAEPCRISVISNDLHDVTGEETIQPAKATLVGPCTSIQENPFLTTCGIDIVLPEGAPSLALLERLAGEALLSAGGELVALRGPHRWVRGIEPVPLPPAEQTVLREGGVYLLTGGLSRTGLATAEHLARALRARLALVGRTGLPAPETWDAWLAAHSEDDRTSQRIRKVQALEEAGAEVLVLQADIAQPEQARAAVEQTLARFGALHGVLHTAEAPEAAAAALAPKVYGTLALAEALRDLPLDFLLLFSSSASATGAGAPGRAAFCGGNAFLDAFAQTHAQRFGRTVAIGWGEWLWGAWNDGLDFPEEDGELLSATRRAYGLTFSEGHEALRRILARRLPHVFVTSYERCTEQLDFLKQRAQSEEVA